MRRRVRTATVVLLVSAATLALVLVARKGPPPPPSLQARVLAVAATLRCPVCQDLSVADSPSTLAGQMRVTIEEDLRAGMSPDQIRARFVESYGAWILLSPPGGPGRYLRLAPFIALFFGVALAALAIRRWSQPSSDVGDPTPIGDEDRRALAEALATETTDEVL